MSTTIQSLDLSQYDRNSLESIGKLVADAIRHHQNIIMTGVEEGSFADRLLADSYEDTVRFAVGQVMRLARGCMNPIIVEQMVCLERKAWRKETTLPI